MKTRLLDRPQVSGRIPIHCSHNALLNPSQLKPNPQNPKKHTKKKISLYAKIIKEGGWRRSIIVSRQSGLIVSGHGAQLAAIELGCKTVPVDLQSFPSKAAEKAAMLADNWLAETMLEYDQTLSAELINELRDEGFDVELAGVLEQLATEDIDVELKEVKAPAPPKMAWVLVGIPTVKYGAIDALIEKLARVKGVTLETTQNDGQDQAGS